MDEADIEEGYEVDASDDDGASDTRTTATTTAMTTTRSVRCPNDRRKPRSSVSRSCAGSSSAWRSTGEINTRVAGGTVYIEVFGDEMGILIGRSGTTLEALQELVRAGIQRRLKTRQAVVVDVEAYWERRRKPRGREGGERGGERGERGSRRTPGRAQAWGPGPPGRQPQRGPGARGRRQPLGVGVPPPAVQRRAFVDGNALPAGAEGQRAPQAGPELARLLQPLEAQAAVRAVGFVDRSSEEILVDGVQVHVGADLGSGQLPEVRALEGGREARVGSGPTPVGPVTEALPRRLPRDVQDACDLLPGVALRPGGA